MKELIFNEENDFSTLIRLENSEKKIYLTISDDLDSAYEPIKPETQQRIWRFIDQSPVWLPMAEEKIRSEFMTNVEIKFLSIYILSELWEEDLVYGLQFWVSEDIEHGRGLKLRENDFSIIDYGLAEVAFD